jgi:hypothetical protein
MLQYTDLYIVKLQESVFALISDNVSLTPIISPYY